MYVYFSSSNAALASDHLKKFHCKCDAVKGEYNSLSENVGVCCWDQVIYEALSLLYKMSPVAALLKF